jgi:cation-transporting ATPase 13A2
VSALRAADVGISLCDAETSVAAPITSTEPSPSSVISVLRHGRCALITAYALVLFNILYAFIQLNMTMVLYGYGIELGNYIYIIQDLFFSFASSVVIAETQPQPTLSTERPPEGFFNKYIVLKLVPQIVVFALFKVLWFLLLYLQSFYGLGDDDDLPSTPLSTGYTYEATAINTLALSQLFAASAVSSLGKPFRRPWYRNIQQVSLLVLQAAWIIFQLFVRYNEFTSEMLGIKPVPVSFAFQLLALVLLQCCVSYAISTYAESFRTTVTIPKL